MCKMCQNVPNVSNVGTKCAHWYRIGMSKCAKICECAKRRNSMSSDKNQGLIIFV